MRKLKMLCGILAVAAVLAGAARARAEHSQAIPSAQTSILLLAHGGSQAWNDNVLALAARINREQPVEVAFGMATRANIQHAVDALIGRGASEIVAVPLFVSSHSSVVTSTEYLLGLRAEAPPDLAKFATMSHGPGGHSAHTARAVDHHAHASEGTRPVQSTVPIRMTSALDSNPVLAAILVDRARAISSEPSREAVVLVAHGPVTDTENEKWLANLGQLAQAIQRKADYASVDYLTVRDDAPAPIRDAATAEFRALVEKHRQSGFRVLIVPVVLSFGGIEAGIRKRLEGLEFTMTPQAIIPDDRLVDWVRDSTVRQFSSEGPR
jgi:sirohydrochlorin ferrochelatase